MNKFSIAKLFWQSITICCNNILLYKYIISVMQQNYTISKVFTPVATIVFLFPPVWYFVDCMASHMSTTPAALGTSQSACDAATGHIHVIRMFGVCPVMNG
jgi:hypothetical protein